MSNSLLTEINKRFEFAEKKNDLYAIATFLDPRYKTKFFSSLTLTNTVKNTVARKCGDIQKLRCDSDTGQAKQTTSKTACNTQTPSSSSVTEAMKAILSSSSDDEDNSQTNQKTAETIEQYIKQKRISTDEDPLKWWKMHEKTFPDLAQLARSLPRMPTNKCCE